MAQEIDLSPPLTIVKRYTDRDILMTISDLEVVTIPQITELHFSSQAVARRRLQRLSERKLIIKHSGLLSGSRGRPEMLITLGKNAPQIIGKEKQHSARVPECVVHHLQQNWVRIALMKLSAQWPRLILQYHTPSREKQPTTKTSANAFRKFEHDFVPDGVAGITDQRSGKSLLFFIEADQATEPAASHAPSSLAKKIQNYRSYRITQTYKMYEKVFSKHFEGFRLLFITTSDQSLQRISRLTASMAPCDFVWITTDGQIRERGIGEPIWVQGGQLNRERRSILGSIYYENESEQGN